jgi:drug/metabolite transporter (DMT)-like permease
MILSESTAIYTTILAEIALALHPVIIKEIPASLSTQLLARLGTYGILSLVLATPSEREQTWGTIPNSINSLLLGLMNIVHIASSYISYTLLPAGSALALFYTYPFMNILAGILFLGDSFSWSILPLLMLAFVGVLLISYSTKEQDVEKPSSTQDYPKQFQGIGWGIFMALVSAVTETLIFLVAKAPRGTHTPWLSMSRLYPGALIAFVAWLLYKKEPIQTDLTIWTPLLLFNIFIGFLGYSLRFFSIPLLPTAVFSILTFIGVVAGYSWGLIFSKEVPNMQSLVGAGLITGSLGILNWIKN